MFSCMNRHTQVGQSGTMLKFHTNNHHTIAVNSVRVCFQLKALLQPQVEWILIMFLPLVIHCLSISALTGTSLILQLFHPDTRWRL